MVFPEGDIIPSIMPHLDPLPEGEGICYQPSPSLSQSWERNNALNYSLTLILSRALGGIVCNY